MQGICFSSRDLRPRAQALEQVHHDPQCSWNWMHFMPTQLQQKVKTAHILLSLYNKLNVFKTVPRFHLFMIAVNLNPKNHKMCKIYDKFFIKTKIIFLTAFRSSNYLFFKLYIIHQIKHHFLFY